MPELEVETKVVNTEQYAQSLTWLQALTGLLERMQVSSMALNLSIEKCSFFYFFKLEKNDSVCKQVSTE